MTSFPENSRISTHARQGLLSSHVELPATEAWINAFPNSHSPVGIILATAALVTAIGKALAAKD